MLTQFRCMGNRKKTTFFFFAITIPLFFLEDTRLYERHRQSFGPSRRNEVANSRCLFCLFFFLSCKLCFDMFLALFSLLLYSYSYHRISKFSHSSVLNTFLIFKLNVSTLVLTISKWLNMQKQAFN